MTPSRPQRWPRWPAAHKVAPRGSQQAFTLAELLVGGVLSVLVVSSLGAIALIAELRMGRDAELNQNLRDKWGRALAFINNEAQQAYWIKTEISSYPCGGEAPSSPLVLEGPPDPQNPAQPRWSVVYGVKSNAGSSNWRGFNRLVRCGPPYVNTRDDINFKDSAQDANFGYLDENVPASQWKESVIADQLAKENPFRSALFDEDLRKDRDVKIWLYMSRRTGNAYPPPGTFGTDYHTQIRASRNPGFDVAGNPACATSTVSGAAVPPTTCINGPFKDSFGRNTYVKEYNLPSSGALTVKGTSNTTDVLFLKGNYPEDFKADRSCNRIRCTLSGKQEVTIEQGNVLVFYNRIMRL